MLLKELSLILPVTLLIPLMVMAKPYQMIVAQPSQMTAAKPPVRLQPLASTGTISNLVNPESTPFHSFIDLSLAARQFTSEEANKSLINSRLDLNLVYNPNTDLDSKDLLNFTGFGRAMSPYRLGKSIYGFYFLMSPSLIFSSGYQQDVYDSKQDSQVGLINGNFNLYYFDSDYFTLASFGVNSHRKHSTLLFSVERSFYGIQAEQQFHWNASHLGVFAEYEIPTAQNLSTKTAEQEVTPHFISGGAVLRNRTPFLQSELTVAYFEFKNLPVKLMSESTLIGNSGTAVNQTEYQFQYDYRGIEAQFKLDFYMVRNFNTKINYSYLVNNSAPDEMNKGSDLFLSQDIYSTKKMSVALIYDFFKIDSDASVAIYNDNNLQTNRVGYLAGVEFKLKQLLSVSIRSGERDVLVENGFQIRERNIILKLETSNVEI